MPDNTGHELKSGKLKLSIDASNASVNIYWQGVQVTRHCGFIAVVSAGGHKRHYSAHASWKTDDISEKHANISLTWPSFTLSQKWAITIQEGFVTWDVWILPRKKILLAEKEAGVFLSPCYTRWINSYEEGDFPIIETGQKDWAEIKLWNIASKSIGVRAILGDNGSLPAVILDYEKTNEETEPKIRNSDYRANMRALLSQVKSHAPLIRYESNKLYKIFSGRLIITDSEKCVAEHITSCKKKLYHQRLPFLEDKIPMGRLSNMLNPVDVLLVNPPWRVNGRCGVRAGSRWPHIKDHTEDAYLPFPFFLAYTASVLLKQGISVRIVDAIAENMEPDEFIDLVDELEPALLIAEVSTPSLSHDLDILRKIRKKGINIALCGLDFNIRQPGFLRENGFVDFVMVGEYEYTSLELFDSIKSGKGFEKIQGLIFRENGAIKINPTRALINDLDALPWPLRDQLPMERYIDAPGGIPLPSVQMWASRGCPFQCTFCAWPQLMYGGNCYRMREPKAIVDEMEYLIKERNFKSVYFDDDSFNINKKNVLDFCKELNIRRISVPWAVMARADTMDEEMLTHMRREGLCAVKYGVESAQQELVDNVRKNINLKQAERIIYFTKSLGIKMHLTFAFGLPGETEQTVKKTIDYAIKLDPDTVQFSIMTPYPGTEYYRQLSAMGYITSEDWSDYDGASKSVIRTEALSGKDLEKAKDTALIMWKRHKRREKFFIIMPFDRGLRRAFFNSLRNGGLLKSLYKTLRYVLNL
jgi:anaerobic magnesium-protoporphyrin IX monomethyl ester cyclase